MRFTTLDEWLHWQEGLHPAKIDLGLERTRIVLERMGLAMQPYAVITVGGTNGKGSCVAMLEAGLSAAGYRVGAYTSPHLLRYNERVRVDGVMAGDADLCEAFARVDQARQDISLTYFEFGTLAALDIFSRVGLDIAILELGMGGRLDATNVLDADVAVVTTVAIDHAQWLGSDRERIGMEKAGIFRSGRPAIYGDADPPASVAAHASDLGAPFHCLGREFGYEREAAGWLWWCKEHRRHALPLPCLRGPHQLKNAATVLMALELLGPRFSVGQQAVHAGLSAVDLPGRLQFMDEHGLRLCDVAHNPQAAAALAEGLMQLPCAGQTHAVVGMLADKDIVGVARAMVGIVDMWHVAGLSCERGATAEQLAHKVRSVIREQPVHDYATVSAALAGAADMIGAADRIVVFGSFHTVAEALDLRNSGWRRESTIVKSERVSTG